MDSNIINIEYASLSSFDIGDLEHIEITASTFIDKFRPYAKGAYIVSKGDLISWRESDIRYLPLYQKLFDARIKKQFRRYRESVIIEFEDISCNGLSYKDETIIGNTEWFIQVIYVINKIGVGSLSMIFSVPSDDIITTSYNLRDTENLRTHVNFPFFNAEISILNLLRLYQTTILNIMYSNSDDIQSSMQTTLMNHEENIDKLHENICELFQNDGDIYRETSEYPIFFMMTDILTSGLQDWKISNAHYIRAVVTGDKNWKRKKDKIVKSQISQGDQSSADSVVWIINDDGTIKIYSSDFETDLQLSKVMVLFEMEILLTVKFFLHKINYFLAQDTYHDMTTISCAELKNQAIKDLDLYYNIDISHKDTTRIRIEKCKEILHINYLYDISLAKLEALSSKLSSEYQHEIIRRELLLIIFFGVFSIGSLSFSILSWYYDLEKWYYVISGSIAAMVGVFIIIILYSRRSSLTNGIT